MKILIISDSHDNVKNIEKILDWAKANQITTMIHAGDLSAPGVLKNTIIPNFPGEIYMICGNIGDKSLLEEVCASYSNVHYFSKGEGKFEIDGKKIFLNHYPEIAEKAFSSGEFDLVIHGHTHKSYIKQQGKSLLLNPGTAGGLYNTATFAVYDTELGNAEILDVIEI